MNRLLLIATLLAGIAGGPSALAATFGFRIVFDSGDLAGQTFTTNIEVTDGDGPKALAGSGYAGEGNFLGWDPIAIDGRVINPLAYASVIIEGGRPVDVYLDTYTGTDLFWIRWQNGGLHEVYHQHFAESLGHIEWTDVQCPGLTLSTQTEVDHFTCTGIARNLVIQDDNDGVDNITNLDALSGLTSVGGYLRVLNNDALTNLDGLSGLSWVNQLDIVGNAALTSLAGLGNVSSIGSGGLQLKNNPLLRNLGGLSGLTSIGGSLYVNENDALTNLDGLSGLTSLGGGFNLAGNDALANLDALSGLTSIGGSLFVAGNDALANLDGLSGLSSVGSLIEVQSNGALTNLDGLSALTSVGDSLYIFANPALTRFCGLFALFDADGLVGSYGAVQNASNPTAAEILAAGPCLAITCPADAVVESGQDTEPEHTGFPSVTPEDATVTHSDEIIPAVCHPAVYSMVRTWTASAGGSVATCTQTIEVVDTTPPVVDYPPGGDLGCNPTVLPEFDPALVDVTDADPFPIIGFLPPSDEVSGCVTTRTILFHVDDCSGNRTLVERIYTWRTDFRDPELHGCPNDATYQCISDVPPPANVTATDDCGDPVLDFRELGGYGSPCEYIINRIWTAVDCAGNEVSCTQAISVKDTVPPTIVCPPDITVASIEEAPPVDPGTVTASDNCGPVIIIHVGDVTEGTACAQVITRTYRATDVCGNWSECSQRITVQDAITPVILCPADMEVANDPGQCGAVVAFEVTATDNCPEIRVTCNPPSGSFFPKGTTTVNCTATDDAGNASACSFNVTVKDDEAPEVTCPAAIEVDNDPGQCGAVVTFAATASDNCPGMTVTCDPASGSFFPKGDTLVTCTATDAAGNTSQCSFTVTVNDTEAPVITCPAEIVVDAQSPVGTAVAFLTTATDNCPGVSVNCSPTSGSVFPIGTTPVLCMATDAAGNTSECSFAVTVRSPAEMLGLAIDELAAMDIHHGIKNALLVKLLNALSHLEAGDPSGAINLLGAFQSQVNAQSGKKLSEEQATLLLDQSDAILEAIGPAPASPLSSGRGRVGSKEVAASAELKVDQRSTIGTDGAGTILRLRWAGAGVLQSADALEGPWEDVPQQVAPFWSETGRSKRFFRIRTPHPEVY